MKENKEQDLARGYLTMAESYRDCAAHLSQAKDIGSLKLRTEAPIYQLYAHSLELSLKAGLLAEGLGIEQLKSYGHDILKMYDCLAEVRLSGVISTAEKNTRAKWKTLLRDARDTHQRKINELGVSSAADLSEFGVYDNATIGNEIPTPRKQIIWLSERYNHNGSLFRYHETRMDTKIQITAFGLKIDVVEQTSLFLGKELETLIRLRLK